ncbi:iron-sulfur cluster assembly protein [Candidatus Bathyarchaeota archaeon]|nr:iron-sulfur cluster assembly protein [Candidatus Bathyarchaeota archaeon]
MNQVVDEVTKKIKEIVDPETGMTLGDMEIIQKVEEKEKGFLNIEFIPTNPFCPIALKFAMDIKKMALGVPGVETVQVYVRGHNMEDQINKMVNT